MSLHLDWDQIELRTGGRVPAGRYACIIEDVAERSHKGKDAWVVTFIVLEPRQYESVAIRDYMWLSEKSLWRIKGLARAAGIALTGVVNLTPEMLRGKVVVIDVGEDTYMGRIRMRVRGWSEARRATATAEKDPF